MYVCAATAVGRKKNNLSSQHVLACDTRKSGERRDGDFRTERNFFRALFLHHLL